MKQYRRGPLTFDYIDVGPADGQVVVLLHGFPQSNTSWDGVIERLTARGYRCIAPNQRGYSPGARPKRRRDYRSDELVEDVRVLIDEIGAQRVHVVGHDWGALVAWAFADALPERVATVSVFSVPHPKAFLKALVTSRQGLASWYMLFFQLPWVPERLLLGGKPKGARSVKVLQSGGLNSEAAERDAKFLMDPGALKGGLNWYRALPVTNLRRSAGKITVPTLYVWSDNDIALTEKPARATEKYVSADYRFEVLRGVSHWIPDEEPEVAANLLLEWFEAHPA
jgi:pimeloyl-ACP methyl ester carboxylesterase